MGELRTCDRPCLYAGARSAVPTAAFVFDHGSSRRGRGPVSAVHVFRVGEAVQAVAAAGQRLEPGPVEHGELAAVIADEPACL